MNPAELAKACRTAAQSAANDAAEQRRLVLTQPDLAARLTTPPLDFKHPEQWNGYIPPYTTCGPGVAARHIRNDSAQRVHLVALVREAVARQLGEDLARTWLNDINTDRWSSDWTPHAVVEGN